VKIHVHTDEPGTALALGTAVGVIEEVDVKNMHVQTAERMERLLAAEDTLTGVVAVCAGAGTRKLFESLGASCVEGGQSMNPATADIVAAIDRLPAVEVVVLPNNKNVILAAEQAVGATAKPARVVPTRSVQAGLGAMVAFEASRPAEENAKEMEDAAAGVRAGAITRASRDAVVGDLAVQEGQFLGLLDGEPVIVGPVLQPVARDVVERLLEEDADVLTILVGEGAESMDDLLAFVREEHPELEVEVHDGGQPHYPLLFAAE
jgi:dihydroxyacetone kinase-like predicted kinase